MQSEVYKNVDTRDKLLGRILHAPVRIKNARSTQTKKRDLRMRVVKCTEVDGGIFEHLL